MSSIELFRTVLSALNNNARDEKGNALLWVSPIDTNGYGSAEYIIFDNKVDAEKNDKKYAFAELYADSSRTKLVLSDKALTLLSDYYKGYLEDALVSVYGLPKYKYMRKWNNKHEFLHDYSIEGYKKADIVPDSVQIEALLNALQVVIDIATPCTTTYFADIPENVTLKDGDVLTVTREEVKTA